jgi:hypothetical protein
MEDDERCALHAISRHEFACSSYHDADSVIVAVSTSAAVTGIAIGCGASSR